ncbi:diaminobutyrate acetyltransferase [Streptomyces sp. 2P-4]|uniref:diaminobutyrate acetyltransferase n=1 Tax=Streptomyces sp. 2P-4 TaxID=2931974 RepID=UPI00253FC9D3|nr:diaminobutyrate acetyltransferase [Streptomyces sp. 2P-4]
MTTAHADPASLRTPLRSPSGLRLDRPGPEDGPALWRLAREAKTLDVNSVYSYLLWCRDFAGTSAVARDRTGRVMGFVTGYVRPDAPGTLFIWQIAVDESVRGLGVGGALLDGLSLRVATEHGIDRLETTITPGNAASERLFTSYAERHGARVTRETLFPADRFADCRHESEVLHRIAPLSF